jgi:hypothetical protein
MATLATHKVCFEVAEEFSWGILMVKYRQSLQDFMDNINPHSTELGI